MPEKLRADFAPTDYQVGGRSNHPVGFVDLAPTMLSLANIAPPEHMQGHAFMGPYHSNAPKYLYGFRGRMDEKSDLSRSIRDERYVYIRNFYPHLPAGQYLQYQQQTPTTAKWHELYKAGKLNEVQAQFWDNHPAEELYDLKDDPHEIKNLVGQKEHQQVLVRFRKELYANTIRTRDTGFVHEGRLQSITAAGKMTRREWCLSEDNYPLEEVFEAANSVGWYEQPSHFAKRAKHPNPTVRYWAAIGLLNVGQAAVDEQMELINQMLGDEAPEVAITAAEIVVKYRKGNLETAKDVLEKYSDLTNGNLFYATTVLNIVERNQTVMADRMEKIKSVPVKDDSIARGGDSVKRLIDRMRE